MAFVCSEGGLLKARLLFPPEFPLLPPTMKFSTSMWHPNSPFFVHLPQSVTTPIDDLLAPVYPDGRVCISILVSDLMALPLAYLVLAVR